MKPRSHTHRVGGLILAYHARRWRRLRRLLVLSAALVVMANMLHLTQAAAAGRVLDSIRGALWVLVTLIVASALYRLLALGHLVFQLRERLARQNHRLHELEAFAHNAAIDASSPESACGPRGLSAVSPAPALESRDQAAQAASTPGPAADTQPIFPSSQNGDIHATPADADALRARFRDALARREWAAALALGREIRARFPDMRMADDFSRVEPLLMRRAVGSAIPTPVTSGCPTDQTDVQGS